MTSHDSSSPLEALLRIPALLINELGNSIPKLADRTRAQVAFAAAIADKLRCGSPSTEDATEQDSAPIADVVPFESPKRAPLVAPYEFDDSSSAEGSEVDADGGEAPVFEIDVVMVDADSDAAATTAPVQKAAAAKKASRGVRTE